MKHLTLLGLKRRIVGMWINVQCGYVGCWAGGRGQRTLRMVIKKYFGNFLGYKVYL
jgi:hypothetical protein